MAYVIGQACIGTKDTACIDVCPTDSIHGYEESNQLFIDPATCIDCDACAQACPVSAIFPGDQVPADQIKFKDINAVFFKSWEKSKSVAELKKATSAAAKTGTTAAAGSTAEDSAQDGSWNEVENWQATWEARERMPENPVEIQKRYGRVRSVFETPEKYIIRFFLAEQTPDHPFVYKYNLPKEITGYQLKATTENNVVKVTGQMKHAKLAKLSGLVNSFPDRFYVELPMNTLIDGASVETKTPHIVDIVVQKRKVAA